MWRVYRCTRKDEDYANDKVKEALAATEIRPSKRSYKLKVACNIKTTPRVLYICQELTKCTRQGRTSRSAGNIISKGFFNGGRPKLLLQTSVQCLPERILVIYEYLGQLFVTPEMVAKKIKAMKDNKLPGVDGIPPELLMETLFKKKVISPIVIRYRIMLPTCKRRSCTKLQHRKYCSVS